MSALEGWTSRTLRWLLAGIYRGNRKLTLTVLAGHLVQGRAELQSHLWVEKRTEIVWGRSRNESVRRSSLCLAWRSFSQTLRHAAWRDVSTRGENARTS